MWADVALVLGAYLLGSAPHLSLMARLRRLRLKGDFHENLWERGGRVYGVIGVIGEFVKGAVPVLVGRWLGFEALTLALAGVAAVGGQMWPVFSRFDGEKGNSIGIAVVFALAPFAALFGIIFPVISLIVRMGLRLRARDAAPERRALIGGEYSRALPLGMFACFLAVPVIAWRLGEPLEIVWGTAAIFVLIILRRLTAGLGADLKTGWGIGVILLRRLLYDRSTSRWRR